MKYLFTVALVFLALDCFFVEAYYCNRISTCRGKPHTACIYQSLYPSARCQKIYATGLTQNEKWSIVNLHNQLRGWVASGQEWRGKNGAQPRAVNMQYLRWEYELESIAQRWAQQCNYGHDSCRDVDRFQVGQNVIIHGITGGYSPKTVEELVMSWYDEVIDFDRNDVNRFRSGYSIYGKKIGHYTQMVWADTNTIGCGAMKYQDGAFNRIYLVCNYGPTGNWPGQSIYRSY